MESEINDKITAINTKAFTASYTQLTGWAIGLYNCRLFAGMKVIELSIKAYTTVKKGTYIQCGTISAGQSQTVAFWGREITSGKIVTGYFSTEKKVYIFASDADIVNGDSFSCYCHPFS